MTVQSPEICGPELLQTLTAAIQLRSIKIPDETEKELAPAIVAMPGISIWPEAVVAMHALRAQVYIDKKKFLDPSARSEDGAERDEDDLRSTHIAVADGDTRFAPRILGCMRLIEKRHDNKPLPVEEHFDLGYALPSNAIEVSRFIAEHPNRLVSRKVSEKLIATFLAYAGLRGLEAYAILETPLLEHLTRYFGLSAVAITPEIFVPKYSTTNLAVKIDPVQSYVNAVETYDPTLRYPGALPTFLDALFRMDPRAAMGGVPEQRKPSYMES